MEKFAEIAKDIFWIGVEDNESTLFENLWPLDNGVTYNAYLCVDNKITLVDCVENEKVDELLSKKNAILQDRSIDYLVINHIEPDHSGGILKLVKQYPDMKIVGNRATFKFLKGYYGIDQNLLEVKNNDTLKTGSCELKFITTPMLHWPETMMTFHMQQRVLFSGDTFGSFGNTGVLFDHQCGLEMLLPEFTRYFANVMGKYKKNILKALDKIALLKPAMIASTHGPIWKNYIDEVTGWYKKMALHQAENEVLVLYGSMYGNTEKMAMHTANIIENSGIKVHTLDASSDHVSYILTKTFMCKGVIVAAPTYNGEIFPWVDFALQMIARFEIENRYVGIFGSKTWSSGVTDKILNRLKDLNWQLVGEPFENACAADFEDLKMAENLAHAMAKQMQTT